MSHFDVTGITKDGTFLRGHIHAESHRELVQKLRDHGLFLTWWKERKELPKMLDAAAAPESAPVSAPPVVPGLRRIRLTMEILDWTIAHSRGAIQTRKQAAGVLLVTGALVAGTLLNARYSLRPKYPPEISANQSSGGQLVF